MSESSPAPRPAMSSERAGTLAAFLAYGLWGIFPVYFKAIATVPPVQILSHRILWSAGLTLLLLAWRPKGFAGLLALARDWRKLGIISTCAALIAVNWGLYIWAVNSGRVADSSLGYYINPLLSIALGSFFLGEKVDRGTGWAVAVALGGVLGASIALGSVPWVSLALASTFAAYGLLKKKAGLDPLAALAAETIVLAPLALAYLLREASLGRSFFPAPPEAGGALVTVLIALAGIVTAVPLLAFAYAANRIPLQRLGFIQYLSPSCQLALGVLVFGERPGPSRILAFGAVAVAVGIYAATRPRGAAATPAS